MDTLRSKINGATPEKKNMTMTKKLGNNNGQIIRMSMSNKLPKKRMGM